MSIDAKVSTVHRIGADGGSGYLELIDRPGEGGKPDGIAGQRKLYFDKSPPNVSKLAGLNVWGSANNLMICDTEIATRQGYTRITFHDEATVEAAIAEYEAKHGKA